MKQLPSILFHMDPGNAKPPVPTTKLNWKIQINISTASDWNVKLRYLVPLWKVRIEVLFPIKLGVQRQLTIECKTHFHCELNDLWVQNRQCAGQTHADGANTGVWLRPIIVRATTKSLGQCGELNMGFYTNDCFIILWDFIKYLGLGLWWYFQLRLFVFRCRSMGLCAFNRTIQNTTFSSKQCRWVEQERAGLNPSKQYGSHLTDYSIRFEYQTTPKLSLQTIDKKLKAKIKIIEYPENKFMLKAWKWMRIVQMTYHEACPEIWSKVRVRITEKLKNSWFWKWTLGIEWRYAQEKEAIDWPRGRIGRMCFPSDFAFKMFDWSDGWKNSGQSSRRIRGRGEKTHKDKKNK